MAKTRKKTLEELTIKDNFLFCQVMSNKDNCKHLLEMILEIKIDHLEVNIEKSILSQPDYKSIRIDVYAKDENSTHYMVEMQMYHTPILKRSRYYSSVMDNSLLNSDEDYDTLPDTYVIFICDYDPFGEGKYKYSIRSACLEVPELDVDDGRNVIILSTKGTNPDEISPQLLSFLKYVDADPTHSTDNFQDPFIKHLQEDVHNTKIDNEVRRKYMSWELVLYDTRKEGHKEGLVQGRAEGRAEGRTEGRAEGRAEGKYMTLIAIVCRKLINGMTSEQISDFLEEDPALIAQICQIAPETNPAYDAEQIYKILRESGAL